MRILFRCLLHFLIISFHLISPRLTSELRTPNSELRTVYITLYTYSCTTHSLTHARTLSFQLLYQSLKVLSVIAVVSLAEAGAGSRDRMTLS
jgi:hypothetical protein